jgi:hypothetical protein
MMIISGDRDFFISFSLQMLKSRSAYQSTIPQRSLKASQKTSHEEVVEKCMEKSLFMGKITQLEDDMGNADVAFNRDLRYSENNPWIYQLHLKTPRSIDCFRLGNRICWERTDASIFALSSRISSPGEGW